MKFEKILVATDGSGAGQRAVELASDIARLHDASLTLLHVINPADKVPDWLKYSDAHALGFTAPPAIAFATMRRGTEDSAVNVELERGQEQAKQAAERLLDDARELAEARGSHNLRALIDEGPPADRILQVAEELSADAIVVGNRGYGNLKGLFVGSVSSQVAKDAKCNCIAVT